MVDNVDSVVDILTGNGDGTFSFGSSYSVGFTPESIVAGDFGNGHVDLAIADSNAGDDDVSVLLGKGNGTFQTATTFATGTDPYDVVAGDFNGDGRIDLATANYDDGISVLLGKGNGTFEESTANPVGDSPSSVVTGDFTGTGNLGVAVLNAGSQTVTILPGNGDGTFQRP